MVCNKPYGVSSQLSNKENMVQILSELCNSKIYPVHRLDTQTTGLMVYAKTENSASVLSSQITSKDFQKEYLCLCHGEIDSRGEMVDYLYHDRIKNKSFVVNNKRNGSKEARLEYTRIGEIVKKEKRLFLVRVKLLTGRTHQIRVQFSSRGNVLYGDGKYGAKDNDRIALHSCMIKFLHPKTKKRMEFSSQPEFIK